MCFEGWQVNGFVKKVSMGCVIGIDKLDVGLRRPYFYGLVA